MATVAFAKSMAWVILLGSVVGAVGAYRYFLTPPELRFIATEAAWFALPFVGTAALAAVVLVLLKKPRSSTGDE